MGNLKTIDSFCGKDPNKTVIHFAQDPVNYPISIYLLIKFIK